MLLVEKIIKSIDLNHNLLPEATSFIFLTKEKLRETS